MTINGHFYIINDFLRYFKIAPITEPINIMAKIIIYLKSIRPKSINLSFKDNQ